jgi:hypothetical protein
MINWLKSLRRHLFGKTENEIREEVYQEPTIKHAREGLQRVDWILVELQKLERKRR